MNFIVSPLQKLSEENRELRKKLATAEQWIWRELSGRVFRKMKTETTREAQQGLAETEEEITKRCQKYLWTFWDFLTEEEKELFVESEINFYHLIRQKDIDGFIVTNAYQKILESIFERYVTKYFRDVLWDPRLHPRKNDVLEKTLYKVLRQSFHLSLGKIYEILQRGLTDDAGEFTRIYVETVQNLPIWAILNEANFWEIFTDIIDTQAFGEKRHNGKITLKDVRCIREKVTWNFENEGLIKIMLEHTTPNAEA